MKIGIYCRVSSEKQKNKGVSIHDQKERGIEFCLKENFEYEVFQDPGYSGSLSTNERPALKKMMEKIFLDELQGIYIVDWDRLSRKQSHGFALKETLKKNEIKIFTAGEEINYDDPTSVLLNDIKILLSEHEIQRLKIRIKRSLERSIKDGKVNGGPMIAFGYTKGDDKIMVIEPDESEVIKLIYKLCLEGSGTKSIANYLNEYKIPTKRMRVGTGNLKVRGELKTEFLWRDSTIHGILKNSLYYGDRKYKGDIYPSPTLKIIEKDEYEAVQVVLKERKHFVNTTNKYFYLLKGLMYCTKCDSRFYGKKRKDLSDNQYICASQRNKGEYCGNRGINIDKLDEHVWDAIIQLPDDIRNRINDTDNPLIDTQIKRSNTLNNKIKKLTTHSENLISNFNPNDAGYQLIKKKINDSAETIKRLNEQVRLLQKEMSLTSNKEKIVQYIEQELQHTGNESATSLEKQKIIRALVKFIGIHYHPKLKRHIIWIEFKISNRTQFILGKKLEFKYKSMGWCLQHDGSDTELLFRKITPDISAYPKIRIDKDTFGFRLNDIDFKESNPFRGI
jgi:site-specific DNA recombinase